MPITFGPPPGITLTPSAGNSEYDLATAEYVNSVLLAGGVTLTPSQALILPSLITAASREIVRYCNRKFVLSTYREIVTPEGTRQDRGEPATAKLSAFPVQEVTSVLTGRQGIFQVTNTDTSTNQYATVAFDVIGDVEYCDLEYVGLKLRRTASGVTSTESVPFTGNATLGDLATAINALGHGWSASVQGNYSLYPSTALVGVREPKNALSQGAVLDAFLTPALSFDIDRSSGIVQCYSNGFGSGYGGFSGPYGDMMDGLGGWANGYYGWGQWQVVYTAGWTVVPADLQLIVGEVVKGTVSRLALDPNLKSEHADKYSWTARDAIGSLSPDLRMALNYYKNWSV